MPIEINVLVIGIRLHRHRITVNAGINPLLNRGVVAGDIDHIGPDISFYQNYYK